MCCYLEFDVQAIVTVCQYHGGGLKCVRGAFEGGDVPTAAGETEQAIINRVHGRLYPFGCAVLGTPAAPVRWQGNG